MLPPRRARQGVLVTDNLRTRIGVIRFQIASWLFGKIDRWLDRYLDRLSEEQLENLYRKATRAGSVPTPEGDDD